MQERAIVRGFTLGDVGEEVVEVAGSSKTNGGNGWPRNIIAGMGEGKCFSGVWVWRRDYPISSPLYRDKCR